MTFETEEISKATLVEVEGRPNLLDRPRERTRWHRFKSWLFPHLKKSEELAEAYAEAKVEKEKSEARKITEQAAEIAARKDLERGRKRILDQKEVQEFSAAVDNIFSDDGLPEQAKAFKFAKLIEKNPQVDTQLDKVKEVVQKLALTRGVNIEVVDESQKSLPEDKDFETGIDEELWIKLNMPIEVLELSVRASNCLESAKVEIVEQLVEMTEADLLKIRSLGKNSLREIKRKLADFGLSLGMTGDK